MANQLSLLDRMPSVSAQPGLRFSAVFSCILAALLPVSAGAQQACAPTTAVLERFRTEHGEIPAIAMLDQRGNRLVVLVNPATRSWSMFALPSANDALACLIAAGHEFGPGNLPPGRQS